MARRRRKIYKWIVGQFDTTLVDTAAGTQRNVTLLTAADIVDAGMAGEVAILRRVVGTSIIVPQGSIAADAVGAWAVYRANYDSAAVAALSANLGNIGDFEDIRWLARRDYALQLGLVAGETGDMKNQYMNFVDWKGACKLHEGRSALQWSGIMTPAWSSFVRLRCLVEAPR